MHRKRVERRCVVDRNRGLDGQLLFAQSSDFAAPTTTGGKRHHQNCPVTDVAQAIGATGRKELCQDVTGHSLSAFAFSRTQRGPDRQPDRLREGRGV